MTEEQKPEPAPTWVDWPLAKERGYSAENLVTHDGRVIGRVERFRYASYGTAIDAKTGLQERGGASTYEAAKAWAERVATGKAEPGDERHPFYHE